MQHADYPALARLAREWPTIRDECAAIDRSNVLAIDRVGKDHDTIAREVIAHRKPTWVHGWGYDTDRWLNYGFCLHDQYLLGDAGAPHTIGLLRHLRGLKIAALSLMKSGLLLPLHTHPELAAEGLMTFHHGWTCRITAISTSQLSVPVDMC
jgi:hypothetical protein